MEIFPPTKVKISDIKGKGRGVVATQNIKKGEIIEYCPVVFLSESEAEFFEKRKTTLSFYYLLQTAFNRPSLMLGYGSLYNHSREPNADVDYDVKNAQNYIMFEAIKDIEAGEEIVYDYEFDNNEEEFLSMN